MKKLRIGIIGTGGISNSHVRAYKQMEDVEIVAGADIIPGKAQEALDRWEFPEANAYETAGEMLEKEHFVHLISKKQRRILIMLMGGETTWHRNICLARI